MTRSELLPGGSAREVQGILLGWKKTTTQVGRGKKTFYELTFQVLSPRNMVDRLRDPRCLPSLCIFLGSVCYGG